MSVTITAHVRNDVPIVGKPLPSLAGPLVSLEIGAYPADMVILFTDPADVERLIQAAMKAKGFLEAARAERLAYA